jgi:hypothetical protein
VNAIEGVNHLYGVREVSYFKELKHNTRSDVRKLYAIDDNKDVE